MRSLERFLVARLEMALCPAISVGGIGSFRFVRNTLLTLRDLVIVLMIL